MGRIRTRDHDLPTCVFEHHGGYRYSYRVEGKSHWLYLGKDRDVAIQRGIELNKIKRAERIRLLAALRQPNEELRKQINERDGYACVYCEATTELVIDHVIPFHGGGATQISNLVTSCATCNSNKGDRNPVEFIADLLAYRERLFDEILGKFITPKP